jgi:hypothetical protein
MSIEGARNEMLSQFYLRKGNSSTITVYDVLTISTTFHGRYC